MAVSFVQTLVFAGLTAVGVVLARPTTIPIWPDGALGSQAEAPKEIEFYQRPLPASPAMPMIRNVTRPTLTVYIPPPSLQSGDAAIICPGGGGLVLDWKSEGTNIGEWLAQRGVTAFVLKYRLAKTPENPAAFEQFVSKHGDEGFAKGRALGAYDARQAMQFVHQHASRWSLNPNRIGFLGVSMGAFIALDATIALDRDIHPAFLAAIYGGDLAGRSVPSGAPALFALAARDDLVMAPKVLNLYSSWNDAGHPSELHLFMRGGHGFGTVPQGLPVDGWLGLFKQWLDSLYKLPAVSTSPS